jgi:2-polyprenyl-3-methyl-5-hydroxy-6-metoxy-1,4-benzoquinol methylase
MLKDTHNREEIKMPSEEFVFKKIYERIDNPEKLPWAHTEPTPFLDAIVKSRSTPGTVLDIGCGSGVDSVYLAEQGWDVTAMDFALDALDMTRARAEHAGVTMNYLQADAVTHNLPKKFDIVVDAGVLHNMKRARHEAYKQQLMNWLSDDGDLVLVHFEKRHTTDWRPIGPRRVSRENIKKFFAPEMIEKDFHQHISTGLPFFIGPTLAMATYWFKRA